MVNTQFDRITVNPDRFGGKPCIRELRISVGMVVQMVAAGKTSTRFSLSTHTWRRRTSSRRLPIPLPLLKMSTTFGCGHPREISGR
jgi:hypothetical protein